jgi:hypothetical protein
MRGTRAFLLERLDRNILLLGFAASLMACTAMLLQHAMWSDETHAWLIATASKSPLDLYWNTRNEGHPGLWHLLLWLGAQVSTDPIVLRFIQWLVAAAILATLAFRSPFSLTTKLLLLSSYFFIFQYSVVARSYGLGVLLLLLAVDAHVNGSNKPWQSWLWLGLAANTSVFGALASIAFALGFALESSAGPIRRLMPALAVYGSLLLVAVLWMMPAPDTTFAAGWFLYIDRARAGRVLNQFVSAFVPIGLPAKVSSGFWEPSYDRWWVAAGFPPIKIIAPIVLLLVLTALGGRRAIVVFGIASTLIICFMYTKYLGFARHSGTFFICFVGCLWLTFATPARAVARIAAALLLLLNTLGGLNALYGAFSTRFSSGEDAAAFIRASFPSDIFLAGNRDYPASTISAFLSRPIYYPQCDCDGTFIRPNRNRLEELTVDADSTLWRRVQARMLKTNVNFGVLISNQEIDRAAVERRWPGLSLILRRAFDGSVIESEDFFLYELSIQNTTLTR